jgi:hypothetical protein
MREGERPSKASPTVVTTADVIVVCAARIDSAGRVLTGPSVVPRREGQGHRHHH